MASSEPLRDTYNPWCVTLSTPHSHPTPPPTLPSHPFPRTQLEKRKGRCFMPKNLFPAPLQTKHRFSKLGALHVASPDQIQIHRAASTAVAGTRCQRAGQLPQATVDGYTVGPPSLAQANFPCQATSSFPHCLWGEELQAQPICRIFPRLPRRSNSAHQMGNSMYISDGD